MIVRALIAIATAAVLAGCTYMEQKADLKAGGPALREAEAQAKLKAAKDREADLFDQRQAAESDEEAARAELAAAEQQLNDVSRELQSISAELDAARRRNAISDAEYKRLKSELGKANQQAASAKLESDLAGNSGSSADAKKKRQQVEALQKKRAELERALTMSTRP
jgi:chromosome segregation ATPase